MATLVRKVGLGCLSVIGLLVIVGLITYLVLNEGRPEGKTGPEADKLAEQMLLAIDKPGWDSLHYISWNFMDRQQYSWDKQAEIAIIKWGETEVLLNLKTLTGKASISGTELEGDQKDQALGTAWAHWCNDSFWLYAPYKIFDPGVERSIVEMDDGMTGLLASYVSGGVTPGDAYLWILNEKNEPVAWKMWVKIIPIGGIYNTWENWYSIPTGGKVAQNHKMKLIDIKISALKAGQTLQDIGYSENPFVL